ncbi:MAG TPA: aminopeptidase P family protein [Acidothermaceae bacterium]|nr:aminopeptidase P family protein [Acidothermaceae bacterium]
MSTGAEPIPARELATTSYDADVSPALTAFMREGWAEPAPPKLEPTEVAPYTAKRRAALSAAFRDRAIVVPAGQPKVRNNDVSYPFRASSDFIWLTGAGEPDSVLVMVPDGDGHGATLFARRPAPRSESEEFYRDRVYGTLWTGPRPSLDEIAATLAINTRPLDELDDALRGVDPLTLDDAELRTTLADLRLVKDEWEIGQLAAACDASARGFADVVRELAAAKETSERWIEGTFWRRARVEGNDVGYGSIAASGAHACVLHWTRDDGPVRDGDLLLLDAGVEGSSFYTADVTRTLPVSGRFTAAQRKVYDLVFEAQSAGLAAVRPGAMFRDYWRAAQAVLAKGLVDWGILPPSAADLDGPDGDLHRRYTLHGTGHMLGLDVHDCATARKENYAEGVLRPGYALTVEPGLYFQTDDLTVPEELRGIGVRIEDDVVVTNEGCRNLTAALPRAADDVEAWMAGLLG